MKPFFYQQIEKLLKLGFHKSAGMEKQEFRDYIPLPRKDKENGLLVVSEKLVSIPMQCALLKIRNEIKQLDDHEDLFLPARKFFYWIYDVDDGNAVLGLSTENALQKFSIEQRRPCITIEALAIYREKYCGNLQTVDETLFIDAAGSRIRESLIPTIWFDHNIHPQIVKLIAYTVVNKDLMHSGVASCSSE